MNDAELQLLLVAGALIAVTIGAFMIQGIPRVLLIAQVAYWSLSYVARPILLLWAHPQPQFGDSIADPRLYTIGYDHGIAAVLHPVSFGLWVYAILVLGYAIWARRRAVSATPRSADPDLLPTLWIVYGIGLLGRAAAYLTGTTNTAGEIHAANPLLDAMSFMAVIGALGLIIYIRPARAGVTCALILGLTAMEFLWTVLSESKTPILGAALAVAIRFALTGWTPMKAAITVITAGLGVGGFGFLQSFKVSDAAEIEQQVVDASYPPVVQPLLSVFRRFDLLESATDSYFMTGHPWMTFGDVAENALRSLVPTQLLGAAKVQSGTAWATDVRGASVDMTHISVSLAEGNINEGFVLGGYAGVVLGVAFTFVLLLATAWALHGTRMIVLVSLGLNLVELPVLFERGFLGSMEVLGKSLQVAVLVWFVYLIVGEYRRRKPQVPSAEVNFGVQPALAGK